MWGHNPNIYNNSIARTSSVLFYSDNSIKNTVLRPNRHTKLVLPKWHKYGILNRVIRVAGISEGAR